MEERRTIEETVCWVPSVRDAGNKRRSAQML
jgi:hypothetical protein